MNKKQSGILNAAREVFLSDGFAAANMETIAERAGVTKQTLYRYFGSKAGLFDATLKHIGETTKADFFEHLDVANDEEALFRFARAFITWHVSDHHMRVLRLVIAEGKKAPEVSKVFAGVGQDETVKKLKKFFRDRLRLEDADGLVALWIGMLLALRGRKLVFEASATKSEVEQYARQATRFLLAALQQFRSGHI